VSVTDRTHGVWANALCVSGNDVCLGGGEGTIVKFWKNSVAVPVTDGTASGTSWGLAVSDGDVNAAGFEYGETLIGPNS